MRRHALKERATPECHCPAGCACPRSRLMQVAEELKQEWREAYLASLERTRGMFEE